MPLAHTFNPSNRQNANFLLHGPFTFHIISHVGAAPRADDLKRSGHFFAFFGPLGGRVELFEIAAAVGDLDGLARKLFEIFEMFFAKVVQKWNKSVKWLLTMGAFENKFGGLKFALTFQLFRLVRKRWRFWINATFWDYFLKKFFSPT